VLVVDDRSDIAELTGSMLTSLRYRVSTAHSGAEALSMLRTSDTTHLPDLIFSDVVMPGSIDGYALVRAARRMIPNLAVLLVSGLDSDAQQGRVDRMESSNCYASRFGSMNCRALRACCWMAPLERPTTKPLPALLVLNSRETCSMWSSRG